LIFQISNVIYHIQSKLYSDIFQSLLYLIRLVFFLCDIIIAFFFLQLNVYVHAVHKRHVNIGHIFIFILFLVLFHNICSISRLISRVIALFSQCRHRLH
jgi:hypothetical protein